jgi:exonuclease VII large subunit
MATDAEGRPVKSVAQLQPADTLALSFADGEATATITDITRGEHV